MLLKCPFVSLSFCVLAIDVKNYTGSLFHHTGCIPLATVQLYALRYQILHEATAMIEAYHNNADLPLPAHPAQLLRDDGDRGGHGVLSRGQEGIRSLGAGERVKTDYSLYLLQ